MKKIISDRTWECLYPLIAGVTALFMSLLFTPKNIINNNFNDLLQTSLTISSIIVGFIATAKAILISIDDKEIIGKIRKVKKYTILIDYFMHAIYYNFVLITYSGILIFINVPESKHALLYFSIWIAIAVTTALACIRIINLFSSILKAS